MGAPSGSIFISYRRGDAPFAAHALYGQLARRFPEQQIFMDVQGGVYAGDEFAEVIRRQVERCDVLIALIGPDWDGVTDGHGQLRLQNPHDLVRQEICLALRTQKRVIPVLVGGAAMPTAHSLPDDLAPLLDRNMFRLSHDHFVPECDRLIHEIQMALVHADGERYQTRLRRSVESPEQN